MSQAWRNEVWTTLLLFVPTPSAAGSSADQAASSSGSETLAQRVERMLTRPPQPRGFDANEALDKWCMNVLKKAARTTRASSTALQGKEIKSIKKVQGGLYGKLSDIHAQLDAMFPQGSQGWPDEVKALRIPERPSKDTLGDRSTWSDPWCRDFVEAQLFPIGEEIAREKKSKRHTGAIQVAQTEARIKEIQGDLRQLAEDHPTMSDLLENLATWQEELRIMQQEGRATSEKYRSFNS